MNQITINNITNQNNNNTAINLSPTQIIVLGFILLILAGTIFLCLPLSSKNGLPTSFTDSLFTATSATCVTGLVIADTYNHWSGFGKFIIIVLIQIGGLGIMSLATLFSIILGRKMGLKQRLAIVESINEFSLNEIVSILKKILLTTFIIEAIGAFSLSIVFIPEFGIKSGIAKSIFHSISAFCNAGFDIIGSYRSLIPYKSNPIIIFTITSLIIVGGLGFIVWREIAEYRRFKNYSLHTKVVLFATAFLIIIGTLSLLLLEFNNPETLGNLPFGQKLMNAYFHSVSPRTAGFSTLCVDKLLDSSKFLTILLMFIGAAPGSTGGGVKVTTIGVLIFAIISVIKGEEEINILEREVPDYIVKRALSIAAMGLLIVIATTIGLLITENKPFIDVLFESASAFGTVGLSTGITPSLHAVSKYFIIIAMYLGRVGPISAAIAFALRRGKKKMHISYPKGRIVVG